ncbi:MAG: GIY-YIG nuclease family protein [Thermoguttaceae bacterium]
MSDSYVYIMTNRSRTLYTGVTNDIERRVYEHKHKVIKGFTSRYNIDKLVWYESFPDIEQAIEGEKKLKGWLRSKKVALIESQNPGWIDLSESWYRTVKPSSETIPGLGNCIRSERSEESRLRSNTSEILRRDQNDGSIGKRLPLESGRRDSSLRSE